MRLFQVLFRRRNMPNGNIYTGKHRIVKPVTSKDIQKLRDQFAIEEKNMFLLRNPYLTPEQSAGHAVALQKSEKRMEKLVMQKKDFRENVTIESRLSHLRHQESWD